MVIAAAAGAMRTDRASLAETPAALPTRGLVTAFSDPGRFASPAPSDFLKVRTAGASALRISLPWSSIAPTAPANPSDPGDPAYHWAGFDADLAAVVAQGLTPIVDIVSAPAWANTPDSGGFGPGSPRADDLGAFAEAAARRYEGTVAGQPAVRYWQVWNEPNLDTHLSPQLVGGKPVSPSRYRAMVNAVSTAVKGVTPTNLVVAGGLAPFRDITPDTLSQNKDWGPLAFMRVLLCLSPSLKPTCSTPVRFDIWSTHPYTSGDPTHHAQLPNDVSLGDLPKMARVLQAGEKFHHVRSSGPVAFWVTEFSWDSKPPDPLGVPTSLLQRWVPQALYQMWSSGVSLVTWFGLEDYPIAQSFYQSGLYYQSGKPKPYLEGFRFPLVAFPRRGGVYVWGRSPFGRAGQVRIERRVGTTWAKLATLPANRFGIFQGVVTSVATGSVRGELVSTGERTLPFSLAPVPDRFYNPFGGTTLLEPPRSHSK
jgi:hypothetical protein